MRGPSALLLLVFAAGCTRAAPLPVAEAGAAKVIVALLDAEGAIGALEVVDGDRAPAFSVRLDSPFPVVTFPLSPEGFVHADGRALDAAALEALRVRRASELATGEAGACGRCVEPPEGDLQVVHAGDSCPPLSSEARLYAAEDGALEVRPRSTWGREEAAVVAAVARQIRLDWPGACAFPANEPTAAPSPRFAAISPPQQPWPYWALAQTEAGVLGLFSEQRQTIWWPSGDTLRAELSLPGRPRAAVALPDAEDRTQRFFVAADRGREGAPNQSVYFEVFVRGGALEARLSTPQGLRAAEDLEIRWAEWLDTPSGPRLALGGARLGRPELALCEATGADLSCTTVVFEGPSCAGAGPIRDLVRTPRGWLAAASQAILQAEPTAGGTLRGWCHPPGDFELVIFDDDPIAVPALPRSLGVIEDRVVVCAEPEGWGNDVFVLSAPLGGAAPFDGAALDFELVYTNDSARCGEFSLPADQLTADPPDRLRLDIMGRLLDFYPDGRSVRVDGQEYFQQTGLPHSAVHQRAPGWLVQRVGWPVEPRGLGAELLVRTATTAWRSVFGASRGSDLVEVVARERDLVAFNAFTDGAPYRIELSSPPRLEAIEQAEDSQWLREVRERVNAALYDPRTQETVVIGNGHLAPSGAIEDDDDRVWRPFLRRLSADLTRAVDVTLPLERGQFLCDAAFLSKTEMLIVGGQGTLLLYDGARFERLEVEYDDPATEVIEEAPIALNSGGPDPYFLSVSAAGGVAWAGGGRGLVVRIARERRGDAVHWVGRRVAIERVGAGGLRTPLTSSTRFTHVVALAPDEAIFAAQRRPLFVNTGCPKPFRERHPHDSSDWVRIAPNPDPSAPWPLEWQTWDALPERPQLPELVDGGLVLRGGALFALDWYGYAIGAGPELSLPFYPTAATVSPDGRVVMVGPNLRVAVEAPAR